MVAWRLPGRRLATCVRGTNEATGRRVEIVAVRQANEASARARP